MLNKTNRHKGHYFTIIMATLVAVGCGGGGGDSCDGLGGLSIACADLSIDVDVDPEVEAQVDIDVDDDVASNEVMKRPAGVMKKPAAGQLTEQKVKRT